MFETVAFFGIRRRQLKASSRILRNRNGHACAATVPAGFSLQNITQASINAEVPRINKTLIVRGRVSSRRQYF
jgi:hypothetical protein